MNKAENLQFYKNKIVCVYLKKIHQKVKGVSLWTEDIMNNT